MFGLEMYIYFLIIIVGAFLKKSDYKTSIK